MAARERRSFPVSVTRLPEVRCQVCETRLAHRPGQAAQTLTHHYRVEHPQLLDVPPTT